MQRDTLTGIIPPVVTPFLPNGDIDEEAMRSELRYMLDSGVHGITAGGSSGEGEKLTVEESCRLARIVVDEVAGAVPVIMGIIQDSTDAVIRYGTALREIGGVDAFQITPVHYLHPPDEEGTVEYYRQIGEALQTPIIIYNVVHWNMIDVSTLLRLADQEWVVGVKQSAGDIERLSLLLERVHATDNPLRVLTAIDTLLFPSFMMGAHGAVAGVVTVLPRLSVALWEACQAGQVAEARRIHERIVPVITLMRSHRTNRASCLKTVIGVQGRHAGVARRPDLPLNETDRELARKVVLASGEVELAGTRA